MTDRAMTKEDELREAMTPGDYRMDPHELDVLLDAALEEAERRGREGFVAARGGALARVNGILAAHREDFPDLGDEWTCAVTARDLRGALYEADIAGRAQGAKAAVLASKQHADVARAEGHAAGQRKAFEEAAKIAESAVGLTAGSLVAAAIHARAQGERA